MFCKVEEPFDPIKREFGSLKYKSQKEYELEASTAYIRKLKQRVGGALPRTSEQPTKIEGIRAKLQSKSIKEL